MADQPAFKPIRWTPPGERRIPVSLLKDTGTSLDESHNRIPSFTVFAKRFAKIQQIGGSEDPTAQQKFPIARYRVNMGYVPGLTEGMQLGWKRRTLDIVSVNDLLGMNREHELICTERKRP